MIINREYVTFRRLINRGDPAGKLFMELFHKSYPEERWDEIYEVLVDQCLYQREMGWAFVNIGELIDGFANLDQTQPFDNGFSFEDITDSDIVWRDENGITLHLINKVWGEIVKVVEITQ